MAKDIKTIKTEDIEKSLQGARKKLQEFRFAVSGSGSKNSKEGRELKKVIAQYLTELKARQNAENK
ncbi:MAG: ribosomal protein L29 [Candidatus Paceibacteria bacterium]|jgi:ribosomal protein L29